MKDGDFYDAHGFYFDHQGFDASGGYYNDNGMYVSADYYEADEGQDDYYDELDVLMD